MSTFQQMLIVVAYIFGALIIGGVLWLWAIAPWRIEIDGMILQVVAHIVWGISIVGNFLYGWLGSEAWIAWTWFGFNLAFPIYSWLVAPRLVRHRDNVRYGKMRDYLSNP